MPDHSDVINQMPKENKPDVPVDRDKWIAENADALLDEIMMDWDDQDMSFAKEALWSAYHIGKDEQAARVAELESSLEITAKLAAGLEGMVLQLKAEHLNSNAAWLERYRETQVEIARLNMALAIALNADAVVEQISKQGAPENVWFGGTAE